METRANVAYFGTFGYELDITKLTKEEQEKVMLQTAFMKEHRDFIQKGTFYRLLSPFDSNEVSWMVVARDKKKAIVGYYKVLAKPNERYNRIKLTGLDPDKRYAIEGKDTKHYGDELMNIGILLSEDYTDRASEYWQRERAGDYSSRLFIVTEA